MEYTQKISLPNAHVKEIMVAIYHLTEKQSLKSIENRLEAFIYLSLRQLYDKLVKGIEKRTYTFMIGYDELMALSHLHHYVELSRYGNSILAQVLSNMPTELIKIYNREKLSGNDTRPN